MRPIKPFAAIALILGVAITPATAAEFVVVVSPSNPLTALTHYQVANLFLGKSHRFPDGAPATPIDLPEGNALRDAFYSAIAGKSATQVKAHWTKLIFTGRGQPPRQGANSNEVKQLLAAVPSAVAYIPEEDVDDRVKVLALTP